MKISSLFVITMAFVLLFTTSSCVTIKKDNGKHKGWYKNPNNPHNPKHVVKKTGGPKKQARK